MFAPESILKTWRKFNAFPMETLTKVWFYDKANGKKQRDVTLMQEHREQYGMSGNCFDLALWLLDEFNKDGWNRSLSHWSQFEYGRCSRCSSSHK